MKDFLKIMVLCAFITACSLHNSQQIKLQNPQQENKHLTTVKQFISAFNQKNVDGMMALVTNDVQWIYLSGAEMGIETQGKTALRKSMQDYFNNCLSCRSEIIDMFSTAERVSAIEQAHWTTQSVNKSQRSLSVYEFNEGLIQRVYYFPSEQTPHTK